MTFHRRTFLLAAGATALAGCASPDIGTYAREKPVLAIEQYFNGRVEAYGMFTNRSGEVVRRFTVTLDCSWNEGNGVLDEHFRYSDGSTQRRVWRIQRTAPRRYTGRADDVDGEATGVASGNSVNWRYTLLLPVDGRTWRVEMDDWMHLVDERVLLNRTVMSKFGVRLGEVQIAFFRNG